MSSLATEESEGTEETQGTTEETTTEETKTETTGSWIDQLDPELQKNEKFSAYSDAKKIWVPKDMVRDFDKLLKEQTEKPTPVESAEAYILPEIEFPEGYENDEETATFFKGLAFKLGMSQEQTAEAWQEFNKFTIGRLNEAVEAVETAKTTAMEQLGKDWGNSSKGNTEVVRRFLKKHADADLLAAIDDTGLGNRVPFIKFVFEMAKSHGEDKIVIGEPTKGEEENIVDVLFPNSGLPERNEI